MGGKSTQTSTTASKTQTDPWAPTIPQLNKMLDFTGAQFDALNPTSNERSALDQLRANAEAGNPYAPQIGKLATDLLNGGVDRTGMVQSGYDQLKGSLTPYTTLDTNPYSNEAFKKFTDTLSGDISNQIRSQYAGAGYSPVSSGDYAQTLGRGISQGVAPTFLQAYNDLESRKGSAIRDLYNAGNTTAGVLSGLDQIALGNRQAGIGASTAAQQAKDSPYERMLQIEGMGRNLPIQNAANLENLILPIAQLGGTSATNSTTTAEKSTPAGQQILGGVMGGLGLLGSMGAFGPAGWLLGGAGALGGAAAGGAAGGMGGLGMLGLLSDRRAKEDIERIGTLNDGQPVYRFRYKGQPETHIGLMAQDVERRVPEAVFEQNGVKYVDYAKATENAVI